MSSIAWGGRRAQKALDWVKARGARLGLPCCICDEPIDYRLLYPDPMSCSVQHVIARALRPDLTWDRSNWAQAHLRCNKVAGVGVVDEPVEELPEMWVAEGW